MPTINSFHGEHRFLSNFWPAQVILDGVTYPTVEHAYVAAKTLDLDVREQIAAVEKPGDVKRFGRKLTLRPDWEDVKLPVMIDLVHQKFAAPDLQAMLIGTGDAELIEGNNWNDTFWGVCRGVGQNHLGKILMAERDKARRTPGLAGASDIAADRLASIVGGQP